MSEEAERAQVFDALSHPTRVRILRFLSDGTLSFADLKKKTNIESSGHLQHHLTKLDGLIKTDEHGSYGLSDAGNDALFAIKTVEDASEKRRHKSTFNRRKSRIYFAVIVAALAACLIVSSLYFLSPNLFPKKHMVSFSQFGVGSDFSGTVVTVNGKSYNASGVSFWANAGDVFTFNFASSLAVNMSKQYLLQGSNVSSPLTVSGAEDVGANYVVHQYLMDIMTGSLNDPGWMTTSSGNNPIQIAPGRMFNHTLIVLSPSNGSETLYGTQSLTAIDNMPIFESNDTYFQQGFIEIDMSVMGIDSSELASFHLYQVRGPQGWDQQIVTNPGSSNEFPPYPTSSTRDEYSPGTWSGGIPVVEELVIPIKVFGNYTVCLENTGNSTIELIFTIHTPVITVETEPLQAFAAPNDYQQLFPAEPDQPFQTGARVVRIIDEISP
jgi:DNA-binding transcriptional ArsR family regulator